MDPYSRRFTWNMIRERRNAGRGTSPLRHPELDGSSASPYTASAAIILTTHSMEEAEALADDIVVMADGRVAAIGTPLQLKHRFGAGYTLSLTLDPQHVLPQQASLPRLALMPAGYPLFCLIIPPPPPSGACPPSQAPHPQCHSVGSDWSPEHSDCSITRGCFECGIRCTLCPFIFLDICHCLCLW